MGVHSCLFVLALLIYLFGNNGVGFTKEGGLESSQEEVALFGGGCFWCLEPFYENVHGVNEVVVGYCGGSEENASYYKVSSGGTSHVETVKVTYNPNIVDYTDLLLIFWNQIDPTDGGGQYDDRGNQYRTVIFYLNQEQKKLAERSKKELDNSGKYEKPIVTTIEEAQPFYQAEERHQNFYEKKYGHTRAIKQ